MFRQTDIFRYYNNSNATFERNVPNRSTLRMSRAELADVISFTAFNNEKANGHCALCMRVLYPEEQKYRQLSDDWLICTTWSIDPVVNEESLHMVCRYHFAHNCTSSNSRRNTRRVLEGQEPESETSDRLKNQYVYPGTISNKENNVH
jgi:hypothetical protein